jgi:hypothetical protein
VDDTISAFVIPSLRNRPVTLAQATAHKDIRLASRTSTRTIISRESCIKHSGAFRNDHLVFKCAGKALLAAGETFWRRQEEKLSHLYRASPLSHTAGVS